MGKITNFVKNLTGENIRSAKAGLAATDRAFSKNMRMHAAVETSFKRFNPTTEQAARHAAKMDDWKTGVGYMKDSVKSEHNMELFKSMHATRKARKQTAMGAGVAAVGAGIAGALKAKSNKKSMEKKAEAPNKYLDYIEKQAGVSAAGKSLPKGKFGSGLGSGSKSSLGDKEMPGESQSGVVPQGIFKSEQMARHTQSLEHRLGRIAPRLSPPGGNVASTGSKSK